MRAGFLYRAEKHRREWYAARGQNPPTLEPPMTPRRKRIPNIQTLTDTVVLKGYRPGVDYKELDMSYWEGKGAGIEPIEFLAGVNALKSDMVFSREKFPPVMPGKINKCYTPYENDIMSFDAFETARKELKRRSDHLASEMERVSREFNRDPHPLWFTFRKGDFTIEHCRFLEKKRRRAAKRQYKDYYEKQEREFHEGD